MTGLNAVDYPAEAIRAILEGHPKSRIEGPYALKAHTAVKPYDIGPQPRAYERVLVEAEKPSHRAIAEGRLLLDHLLDRVGEARIDLRCGLGRLIVRRGTRNRAQSLVSDFAIPSESTSSCSVGIISCPPAARGLAAFIGRKASAWRLTICVLQTLQLLLALLADAERFGPQGVLHTLLCILYPASDVMERQVE